MEKSYQNEISFVNEFSKKNVPNIYFKRIGIECKTKNKEKTSPKELPLGNVFPLSIIIFS